MNWKIAVICTVLLALLFVPYPTTVVPEWNLQFVDEHRQPIPRLHIEQTCDHFTYFIATSVCGKYSDSRQYTDADGRVVFSEKVVYLGLLSRILRTIRSYALLIFHGSVGIRADLNVIGGRTLPGGRRYKPQYHNFSGGIPADGIVVLHEEPF
ncbi:MAG: hypothetical protein WBO10_08590 [Pyrinomonadaceae bacterium]